MFLLHVGAQFPDLRHQTAAQMATISNKPPVETTAINTVGTEPPSESLSDLGSGDSVSDAVGSESQLLS